jgi:hypothetical protein
MDKAIEVIQEAYENSVLNEMATTDKTVADMFARYLIGDHTAAVSQLKTAQPIKTDFLNPDDSGDYNTRYQKLYKDLLSVIKKHMK